MAGPEDESKLGDGPHSPPPLNAQRPKGILKNSYRNSPPVSPTNEQGVTDKQITIENTNKNAGHRRSSSTASRPRGYSRTGSHSGAEDTEPSQRLKWDEANLYLTEQERTSTMKITEPKTPYAQHYEPSEDEDEEMLDGELSQREEIPGLSLGEPEEEVPERPAGASRKKSKVHVHDDDAAAHHDADHEYIGMSAEEREKHRKFEQLRRKHYEMKDAAKLLGHAEDAAPDEDVDENPPPMPTINGAKVKAGD